MLAIGKENEMRKDLSNNQFKKLRSALEHKSTDVVTKKNTPSPDSVLSLRANLERKAKSDGAASVANLRASLERKNGTAQKKGDAYFSKLRDKLETKTGSPKKTTNKNKDVADVCNASTFAALRANMEEKAKTTDKKGLKKTKLPKEDVVQISQNEVFRSLCTNMEEKANGKGREAHQKNNATIEDISQVCKADTFATLRAEMEEKAKSSDQKIPKEKTSKLAEVSKLSKIDSHHSDEKGQTCESHCLPEINTEPKNMEKTRDCNSDSLASEGNDYEVCNADLFAQRRANMEAKSVGKSKDERQRTSPKEVLKVCDPDSFSNLRANMEEKANTGSNVVVDLSDFIKQQNEGKRLDKAKKGEASFLLHSYHGKAALVGTIFDPDLILNQDKGGTDSNLHAAANRAAAAVFLSYNSMANGKNIVQKKESMEELNTEEASGERSFSSAKVCTFIVHVDHGFIINSHNINDAKKKDRSSYVYGGDIDLNEFLAAVRACRADTRARLLTAAKLAATRHVFQQTGIDTRDHIERLRPCEIQSDNDVKGLNCELKGVLYFCLFVNDDDFPSNVSIS